MCILSSSLKVAPRLTDGRDVEIALVLQTLLSNERLTPLAERSAQPLRQRDAKARLGPIDDRLRHELVKHGAKYRFALACHYLLVERQSSGEFHEPVVEQRS